MFLRKSLLASCAAASLVSPSTHAEEAPDIHAERTIIVTAHGHTDSAENLAARTPGGADIVTYADYADKAVMSLRDTLAFSPGVYLQPRFGQEIRISVRGSGLSRGFHLRGLTLLQDGVPINLADDNGDFQELEPIFFDHLEVYRGANALRFGSGTLGGAINGVTPRGIDATGLYVRADGGSFGTLRGLASYGGTSGRADFWAGLSADRSDGDRNHAKRRSLRFHGNIGLQLSDRIDTRFYASFNRIRQQLPGALSRSDALIDPAKANPSAIAGNQARDIDSVRLQSLTRIEVDGGRLAVGVFLNKKDLFHPIFQVIDQASADAGAFGRFDYEKGALALTLGGEIRRGSTRAKQYLNSNGRRGAMVFDADQDAQTANIYGEVRFRPTDRLSVIAGAIHAAGWRGRRTRFSSAQNGRVAFREFSPKVGVLYEPSERVQFYANYSRSAEFPGFGEIFQTVSGVSSFIGAIRPQTAWTAEIGTRGTSGVASWDVSLYRADLTNEMLQYATGGNASIPASTFNAGHTRHQGIEAALSLEPTDWLRLRQVYQYSDFRFRNDPRYGGNRLPVVPPHLYRAELRLGTDALHVAPNVEWVPRGAWADYGNTLRTGGYALPGVTAGATVARGMDLFLDARNITRKRAIGDISATTGVPAASAIFYPVERRAVYGGVRMRF